MNCLYMGVTPELISAADREAFAGMGPHPVDLGEHR